MAQPNQARATLDFGAPDPSLKLGWAEAGNAKRLQVSSDGTWCKFLSIAQNCLEYFVIFANWLSSLRLMSKKRYVLRILRIARFCFIFMNFFGFEGGLL